MMARPLIALWSLLLLAIAGLILLAQFWIQQRKSSAETRVQEILRAQLEPVNRSISQVIEEYSIALQKELNDRDLRGARDRYQVTRHPLADAFIVVDDRDQLQFPLSISDQSRGRQSLVDEALQLLREPLAFAATRGQRLAMGAANDPVEAEPADANQTLQENFESQSANSTQPFQNGPSQQASTPIQQSRIYYGQNAASNTLQQPSKIRPQASNTRSQPSNAIQDSDAADRTGSLPAQLGSEAPANITPKADTAADENADGLPSSSEEFGWITWYHRRGMVLGFWWSQPDHWRSIIALPRARWMADIIAVLPGAESSDQTATTENVSATRLAGSVRQLVDVEGNVIHQWGDATPEFWKSLDSREPMAEVEVTEPLEGWRLRVLPTDELVRQLGGDDMVLPIWLAVGGLTSALLVGGGVISITLQREMRLASQRVSFVNQVSHELRTPLTNIRMYAELLARDLVPESEEEEEEEIPTAIAPSRAQQRLTVIQGESQRLSRLINNVLEFARSESHSEGRVKPLRMQTAVLDDVIREVLDTFRPRLEELQFKVEVDLYAATPRMFDPDAVEQILINLIGNAEKYAGGGRHLKVESNTQGNLLIVRVSDSGPGIPNRLADKIFLPFQRISDRLEDPAGTGIGLTIVRDLSRRHGGDCQIIPSQVGAVFECRIQASEANAE